MDVQTLRSFRNTEPFRPFMIQLNDGRKLLVVRQPSLAIAPNGSHMAYISGEDELTRFKIQQVRSIEWLTAEHESESAA
jgi:hypothetical protein